MTGLNRQALDEILADLQDLPSGSERFSDFKRGKLRSIMDHANTIGESEAEVPAWKEMVQAYLGCVAFADACLGRLFEGLEKSPCHSNAVVILWGDHGYHLGPKYHVAKQALWEKANRTLLMIHDPRHPNGSNGRPRRQLASLTDLYPTVCELGAVPLPGPNIGRSLVSLLDSADAPPVRDGLLHTNMEGNHALRTERYAYLRYRDGSTELYDMERDPRQRTNLARLPEHAERLQALDARLNQQLSQAIERLDMKVGVRAAGPLEESSQVECSISKVSIDARISEVEGACF